MAAKRVLQPLFRGPPYKDSIIRWMVSRLELGPHSMLSLKSIYIEYQNFSSLNKLVTISKKSFSSLVSHNYRIQVRQGSVVVVNCKAIVFKGLKFYEDPK